MPALCRRPENRLEIIRAAGQFSAGQSDGNWERPAMLDAILLLATAGFFAAAILYAAGCEKM
jgi:hypothetical protein